MRVLILDGDETFARSLAQQLWVSRSIRSSIFERSDDALEAIRNFAFGLAVVELEPPTDGGAFLRQYREIDPLLQAVIVTGYDDRQTAVRYLRGGPDALAIDYVVKPIPDLLAFIDDAIQSRISRIDVGPWGVDLQARQARYNGMVIELTPIQMAVYVAFLKRPGQIMSYEELAAAVGHPHLTHEQAVHVYRGHVSRLRDKLKIAAGRDPIESFRGEGLRFTAGPGESGGGGAGYGNAGEMLAAGSTTAELIS